MPKDGRGPGRSIFAHPGEPSTIPALAILALSLTTLVRFSPTSGNPDAAMSEPGIVAVSVNHRNGCDQESPINGRTGAPQDSVRGSLGRQPVLSSAGAYLPDGLRRHVGARHAFPPSPGPDYIVDRMISRAGGWRRWRRVRTLARLDRVEILDRFGRCSVRRRRLEKYFYAKCGAHPRMLIEFTGDSGTLLRLGLDGDEYWLTEDERPVKSAERLEEAIRRMRETWFWLRYPFSLRERGTRLSVGGRGLIDGGRRPVWYLDVLPARCGDGWPLGRLRILVNQQDFRTEGVIYPKLECELKSLRARFSNYCALSGFFLPHRRDVFDEEGKIARVTVLERLYDVPLEESIFHAPVFHHY